MELDIKSKYFLNRLFDRAKAIELYISLYLNEYFYVLKKVAKHQAEENEKFQDEVPECCNRHEIYPWIYRKYSKMLGIMIRAQMDFNYIQQKWEKILKRTGKVSSADIHLWLHQFTSQYPHELVRTTNVWGDLLDYKLEKKLTDYDTRRVLYNKN